MSLSADFLMHAWKVEACRNPFNHDWAQCVFAHPKVRSAVLV